jgi:integrase/recombinase XerD
VRRFSIPARHGFVTVALESGAPLHVVQDAAAHADPRTTRRYDRARRALDGHAAYQLASYVAGVTTTA